MGFLSQQITAPNYWHYAYPSQAAIAQQGYQGQVGAYTTYMNDLWEQWENYRRIGEEALSGLGKSASAAYDASMSRLESSRERFLDDYKQQEKDLKEETEKTKAQTTAAYGFRGMGNTTTLRHAKTALDDRSKDIQDAMTERRDEGLEKIDLQIMGLNAQEKEWADQSALWKMQIESTIESQRPITMDPGPGMHQAHLENLINMGHAAQNPDIVTGEEGGWGSLALTGLGGLAGGIFGGPAGMMLGMGLGGALGGGLEMGFGAPGHQQQGGQQMLSGLTSAAMIGMSPYSDWSWGSSPGGVDVSSFNPGTGGWQVDVGGNYYGDLSNIAGGWNMWT